MENPEEDPYLCVGVCMADPDSGYCLGCGRPPLGDPGIVAEAVAPALDRQEISKAATESPE